MDAAFHERDTHVTAKCNVCFKGVNAAGGAAEVRHTAIGEIASSQKAAESATRTERSKRQGEAASSERQSREARDRRQRPNRMASTRRQTANDEQHVTQREADGRRRACATTPRSSESSIASKQGCRDRKWRNGVLLQGQLFKKRRVAHGKEYVLPDRRQHRFHGEAPPREKQAP